MPVGRPRKDAEETAEKEETTQKTYTLKICPKCQSEAAQPYKDLHGFFRCNCSVCGFWDCIVSTSPADAAKKWQAMGGPADRF
jgi:hypothetical protein